MFEDPLKSAPVNTSMINAEKKIVLEHQKSYGLISLEKAILTNLKDINPSIQFTSKKYRNEIEKCLNTLFFNPEKSEFHIGMRLTGKFLDGVYQGSGVYSTSFSLGDGLMMKTINSDSSFYHEAFVGFILNQLRDEEIYNFMYTYGVYTCSQRTESIDWCDTKGEQNSILILERLIPFTGKKTKEILNSVVNQIFMALLTAYTRFGFVHHDMNAGNYIIINTEIPVVRYKIYGKFYYIKTHGVIPVILDFGNSDIIYQGKKYIQRPRAGNFLMDLQLAMSTLHIHLKVNEFPFSRMILSNEWYDKAEKAMFIDVLYRIYNKDITEEQIKKGLKNFNKYYPDFRKKEDYIKIKQEKVKLF
jgi:hypothetical protein